MPLARPQPRPRALIVGWRHRKSIAPARSLSAPNARMVDLAFLRFLLRAAATSPRRGIGDRRCHICTNTLPTPSCTPTSAARSIGLTPHCRHEPCPCAGKTTLHGNGRGKFRPTAALRPPVAGRSRSCAFSGVTTEPSSAARFVSPVSQSATSLIASARAPNARRRCKSPSVGWRPASSATRRMSSASSRPATRGAA
jgi:hypothetical protein